MIYLIGGAPRCGKTIAARRLARRLGCSWFPVDYLGAAVRRYLAPDLSEVLFPPLGRELGNDERFARYSPEELVVGFRVRARTVWPGLRAILEHAAADEHPCIFEGFQIEPAFVRALADGPYAAQVRAVFLYRLDPVTIAAGLQAATEPRDWARQRTTRPETFGRIAAMVGRYGEVIRDEAAAHGLPAVNLDASFHERLDEALAALVAGADR